MTTGDVEDGKNRQVVTEHQHHQPPPPPPPPFQGVSNNYPPPPQPKPPASGYPQQAQPYVPGYAVAPVTEHDRLPCCGIGVGWVLFILGFFFGAIPWYIGFFLLCFSRNPRERPGCIACAIGSVIATIFIVIGVIREVKMSTV